jgi:hypothetical protein
MGNPRVPVYPHGYGYGDDLLPMGGYGAGYMYWFALLGTSLVRQNPWVLYPLTSLLHQATRAHDTQHWSDISKVCEQCHFHRRCHPRSQENQEERPWMLHPVVHLRSTGRCTTTAPPIQPDSRNITSTSVSSSSGLPAHLSASTSG